LADRFKVSKSSVSRIVKEVKAQDTERAEAASTEESKEGETSDPNSNFTYTPETEERVTLELDHEADQGVSRLLDAHVTEDPLAIDDDIQADDSTPAGDTAGPAPAQTTEEVAMPEVSERDMDMLLRDLLPADELKENTRAPTRSKLQPPQRRKAPTAQPPKDGAKAHVPMSVLFTQIKMYVAHMGDQLSIVIGKTDQERERFLKSLKPSMPREEAEGILCSIKGALCIQQAVSGIESSIFVGAGCAQSLCPMVGINLSHPVNVMTELDKVRDQIRMNATQMVIDDFNWYQGKASSATSLALLCVNTVFTCDAQNRAYHAQQVQQPQPTQMVDEHTQEKYRDM
jgi:hypothetical protein